MKFWTTGRIDEMIEFEIFQPVMLEIESRINNIMQGKEYGDAILAYDIIINIFKEGSEEKFKYSPKNKETDIEVNINHDEFIEGNFNMRCKLYLNAILHSLNEINKNKHLGKFDFDSFRKDLMSLFDKYTLSVK